MKKINDPANATGCLGAERFGVNRGVAGDAGHCVDHHGKTPAPGRHGAKRKAAFAAGLYGAGFACVYDTLMHGNYSYQSYADYVENAFRLYGAPKDSLIADLGCGTGSMCVELAKRGYDMIGIDNSPQMLAEAREKTCGRGAQDILFLEQEICDFELYGTVGAFISTIDCINYITDKRRLNHLFKLVDNYLSPGGLFIFDINTEYKLAEVIGNGLFYEVSDELCYLWLNSYSSENKTSVSDLTLFVRESGGLWQRFDEIHRQRAYAYVDFESAIKNTHLEIIGNYRFLSFEHPDSSTEKSSLILIKA